MNLDRIVAKFSFGQIMTMFVVANVITGILILSLPFPKWEDPYVQDRAESWAEELEKENTCGKT